MKYQVTAKVVGPYLPDTYSVSDINLLKEEVQSPLLKFPAEDSGVEAHLTQKGVNHRIAYNKEKPHYRKFNSSHIIRITIENENPYEVFILARIRIEQLIESLTIASFSIEKSHQGREMSRNISDIYQYQILGIVKIDGDDTEEIDVNDFTTGVNYFPKDPPEELIELTNEILGCNDDTLRKAMHYLKRAKTFSFDYYSELEIFLNSMKCIELFANKFYPHGLKKQNGRFVTFQEKMEGFDANQGAFDILNIDLEYRALALDGWHNRNNLDIAHASEYFKLIARPFPDEVNEAAYHFTPKYIQYLKVHEPDTFCGVDQLDSDWWAMFR